MSRRSTRKSVGTPNYKIDRKSLDDSDDSAQSSASEQHDDQDDVSTEDEYEADANDESEDDGFGDGDEPVDLSDLKPDAREVSNLDDVPPPPDHSIATDTSLHPQPTKSKRKQKRPSTAPAGPSEEELEALAQEQHEVREMAWKLAHPPRKAFKATESKLERAWMNKECGWMFRNNNNRMQVSGPVLQYFQRQTVKDPKTGKPAVDWDHPDHGANAVNLARSYVKWLWDDGVADARMAHPLDIDERQDVRCDEAFGTHQHANDSRHPHSTACSEPPAVHAALHEEGKTDYRGLYDFRQHDFVYCAACRAHQRAHLSASARLGELEGALFALCGPHAERALHEYGAGWAGCKCDLAPRCLAHRGAHLASLAAAKRAFEDAPANRVASAAGTGDVVVRCPDCPRPPFPHARPFAFKCVHCDGYVVMPRGPALAWKHRPARLQKFVRELDQPNYFDLLSPETRRQVELRDREYWELHGGDGGDGEADDDVEQDQVEEDEDEEGPNGDWDLTADELAALNQAGPIVDHDDEQPPTEEQQSARALFPARPLDSPFNRVSTAHASGSGAGPASASVGSVAASTAAPASSGPVTTMAIKRKRSSSPAPAAKRQRSDSPASVASDWRRAKEE